MSVRLNYWEAAPAAYQAMRQLNDYIARTKMEKRLRFLVQIHVSRINGCTYCIERHTAEALHEGEQQVRIESLAHWQSASHFSARERAALAWSESLTNVAQTHAPDSAYRLVREQFDDAELVDITLVISVMNAWNRMAIGFGREASKH